MSDSRDGDSRSGDIIVSVHKNLQKSKEIYVWAVNHRRGFTATGVAATLLSHLPPLAAFGITFSTVVEFFREMAEPDDFWVTLIKMSFDLDHG